MRKMYQNNQFLHYIYVALFKVIVHVKVCIYKQCSGEILQLHGRTEEILRGARDSLKEEGVVENADK